MDVQSPKPKVHRAKLNKRQRSSPSIFGQPKSKVGRKTAQPKVRTKEDFLEFCITVLNYEDYHPEETKCIDERDYNMNSCASPVNDSLGSNSDSGESGESSHNQVYDGTSTATATSPSSVFSFQEDDEVTCFCNKPYANRPMIQCGYCETWIHLSCAKIRRNHIPDVYVCKNCRETSQHSRKSGRRRVGNKKFVDEI